MKILFLLTQDLQSPAGVGRYLPLAQSLVRRGHQVRIAALHSDFATQQNTQFEAEGVAVHYVGQMHVLKRGDQKTYFPAYKLLGVTARATIALSREALAVPADIIHVGKPQPMNGIAGLVAKTLQGKRMFLDCDDLEAANNRFSGSWQKRTVTFFETLLPRRADHITTHTTVLRDRLIAMGVPEGRITYVPHGVDASRFAPPAPGAVEALRGRLGLSGKKVIVFVGSMSLGSHAVDLLVEAFGQVYAKLPESRLLLVGGGEDYERIRRQIQACGLQDFANLHGRVPPDQAQLYYRLGDVSVDPVPDNESGRASLSLKIFESWACGAPLVTTDVGDRRKVLGEPPAGLLARPGDPQALAGAILQVLNEPEIATSLRQRGLAQAKHYSWDNLAERVETAYRQSLAGSPEIG